ncbi:tagatose 6-phosphate kinase [Austwickia chelonae]|uniref:Putative sugar kinase n=1 Tax=Austwickia chelonae NBRC 105200 TaxID=1184607 RepID=K6V6W0_9MICO|nr:1-phosphofructokinase family hexose kinase [Austwickia chelonae]GAB77963.1 putative sugar kinase [Austwickia chelonae NBRC 105200]SEV93182.1 tagatose 6-phosphate kinase [Austwickia chelonae]
MIVTVTANPALDITYRLDEFHPGHSHRIEQVAARAGGKGINVAAVLRDFGYPVTATGVLGGATGRLIAEDLRVRGLDPDDFVPFDGENRRTVNVLTPEKATMLNEAGPLLDTGSWTSLERRTHRLLARPGPAVLVISGSLPPGADDTCYARLLHSCGEHVVRIVDVGGSALLAACTERPDLVKPNRIELAAATGLDDPVAGAEELLRHGARQVVVSDGERGILLVRPERPPVRAYLDAPLSGNPTGAGDALAAAFAAAAVDGRAFGEALRRAVTWSAAAVLSPVAGCVDPERADGMLTHVVIEEIV